MLKISEKSENVLRTNFRAWFTVFVFALFIFGGTAISGNAQIVEDLKTTTTSPERLSASFAEISKLVEPAVVNIDTKGKVPDLRIKDDEDAAGDDDILDFLRRQQQRPSSAVGSGFIVDKSGYIMTNRHVVDDASRITVRLQNGDEHPAKVIGTDEETDLAILKINVGRDLPFVKLGNSEAARVGDWVLAVGSPFGLAQTVTAGIISQTKRETPYATPFQKFIQTDAAINRGNSGGPLVNMNGEVIGINSQIATSTGDYNGIGFALPSNEAANVYRQILENGKVRRGYLGVSLDSVKTEFAEVYKLPDAKGAIILNVTDSESAAGKAGLKANDVILEFNGKQIENAQDLIQKVSATAPNETISLLILRENGANLERTTATIKLDERPINDEDTGGKESRVLPIERNNKPVEPLGLTLEELTAETAKLYRLENEKGLIVKRINPASFIADVKSSTGGDALNRNDLIQRINRQPVTDLKSYYKIADKLKTGDAVVLHVLSYNPRLQSTQMRIVQFTVE